MMKQSKRLVLSAGEECTIVGQGMVQVALYSGVLDIAGAMVESERPFVCHLTPEQPSLVVYTLEGGAGTVSGDGTLDLRRAVTRAAPLVQLTCRTLLPLARSTVLVIGRPGEGKTLAAHTLCNALLRYSAESDYAVNSQVYLMDLNMESNCVYSPGCVTLARVTAPLWLGQTGSPSMLTVSLYTGCATRPSATTMNGFVHHCEQLYETAVAYMDECGCPNERKHLIIDAPAPSASVNENVFYKKLIAVMRPTHIVVVAERDTEAGQWASFLHEDVQRTLPDCSFAFTAPVTRRRGQSLTGLCLQTYFVGNAAFRLGCSKVVLPTSALHFVKLAMDDPGAAARRCRVTPSHRSSVCALSHAEIIDEVALAPIAGLLILAEVDEDNEEVTLLIPAGTEPLQRRFVIVPSDVEDDALRLSDAQLATIVEATVC